MSDPDPILKRLTQQLDRAAALRTATNQDPELASNWRRLRSWQAVRLARTHAALLASPRTASAAAFFLTDLYGSEDLSQIDADVLRVIPAMKRLMPAAGLETVADAIELEALSEDLDLAMVMNLGPEACRLTAATYAGAYRRVGRRPDRERQIDLIEHLGKSLDRLVRLPLVGATLRMMRTPAKLAGVGRLQDFLQRGYTAFVQMRGSREFLELVVGPERQLMEKLFAGDDRPLGG